MACIDTKLKAPAAALEAAAFPEDAAPAPKRDRRDISALAVGVTYNAARIALSERGREFATLRVLGFTRAEISYLLLGEIALLAAIALPLGCLAGRMLARLIVSAFKTELYRVPFVLDGSSYGWAMIITIVATAVSAVLVRRRLDRLDLIAVLKTRE